MEKELNRHSQKYLENPGFLLDPKRRKNQNPQVQHECGRWMRSDVIKRHEKICDGTLYVKPTDEY